MHPQTAQLARRRWRPDGRAARGCAGRRRAAGPDADRARRQIIHRAPARRTCLGARLPGRLHRRGPSIAAPAGRLTLQRHHARGPHADVGPGARSHGPHAGTRPRVLAPPTRTGPALAPRAASDANENPARGAHGRLLIPSRLTAYPAGRPNHWRRGKTCTRALCSAGAGGGGIDPPLDGRLWARVDLPPYVLGIFGCARRHSQSRFERQLDFRLVREWSSSDLQPPFRVPCLPYRRLVRHSFLPGMHAARCSHRMFYRQSRPVWHR